MDLLSRFLSCQTMIPYISHFQNMCCVFFRTSYAPHGIAWFFLVQEKNPSKSNQSSKCGQLLAPRLVL